MEDPDFNPFASEEILPPHTSHWAARRELAEQLREFCDLAVTTDASEDTVRSATRRLAEIAAELKTEPRLLGTPAIMEAGHHGSYPQINHELNALGGWSNPLAPGLNMWIEGEEAHGRVRCHHAYEGPPGFVHGGFVAAIFDQFLGMAQIAGGNSGMTGTITIRYHRPTPLDTELQLLARVQRVEGRKTIVTGEMRFGDQVTATGEALFIRPSRSIHEMVAQESERKAAARD